MLVLVTYDVNTETPEGKRRLRLVARACVRKGRRVQSSVFECLLNSAEFISLKHELSGIVDQKHDSLRFYNLGNEYRSKIETIGKDRGYDPSDTLMI
ncbi:CRISPR-associated endonuclease Cas2 [Olsenella sp. AM30-3LB]|jgi:CRISPR-associated protein Cas2|uniref:CRISPR-associated endonuclease Cas2 n=1 Tax=unclassified Olsenella TaxID=2638792 RepID=UPI000E4FEFC0|nr:MULTISPECIES: CRISPR-associated endonuclease Cas2 [unclassified Olsenella]RHD75494.1 CRISPR-associated endonuclease Cas2 [Olsenella sp. AM30-3LB]RHK04954.1 CRISPR-associated endonuclease Cas2 [Olsenella sp. AM04-33]